MNPEYEKELENWTDRELRALPQLAAPPDVARRVIGALAEQQVSAGYPVRSLPFWKRAALFLCMPIALVCIASILLQGQESSAISEYARRFGTLQDILTMVFRTAETVLAALCISLKHLGAPFLVAVIAVALVSYFALIGLGTAWYRIAFATAGNQHKQP